MPSTKWPSIAATACLIIAVTSPRLPGTEPTIESLVAGVPILSPDTELLDRFRFTLETPLPFEVPIVATLAWKRPDEYGMIAEAGKDQAPFWFLSQNKSMMFDVTTGSAILGEAAGPQFIVQVRDDKFTIKYSLTSQLKTEVNVDLPSLLGGAIENGKLDLTEHGHWRVTTVSPSGKSRVIAEFMKSKPFSIRHLETRSVVDGTVAFAIRDITINATADIAWPAFPPAGSFPESLKLIKRRDHEVKSVDDGFDVVTHGIRTLLAQGALRNPKWRTTPYLQDVDWTATVNTNAVFGPKLHALFRDPANELREPAPPSGSN